MKVVRAKPPNYAEIVAAFPAVVHRHGVLYAFGETVYNPDGVLIPPQLVAHESVHCERQTWYPRSAGIVDVYAGPQAWWDRYIHNPQFRLDEEIVAHRAEWLHFKTQGFDRNTRRAYLAQIAKRLASPMYGSLVSMAEAKRIISTDVRPAACGGGHAASQAALPA